MVNLLKLYHFTKNSCLHGMDMPRILVLIILSSNYYSFIIDNFFLSDSPGLTNVGI